MQNFFASIQPEVIKIQPMPISSYSYQLLTSDENEYESKYNYDTIPAQSRYIVTGYEKY